MCVGNALLTHDMCTKSKCFLHVASMGSEWGNKESGCGFGLSTFLGFQIGVISGTVIYSSDN